MSKTIKIPTSREVYAVIHARHKLKVFSSFSNPNGNQFGGSGEVGEMWTQWGFDNAHWPLLEARTTWTINHEKPHERIDEIHEYWLLMAVPEES